MGFSVMTWNVLEGAGARFPLVRGLIAERNPDVLVVQEALGWSEEKELASLCEALKLPFDTAHCHLMQARPRGSGRRFHVGVVSRFPIQSVKDHTDPHFLGHGITTLELATSLGPLRLLGTHFDSHHENLRFVEARYLRSLLSREEFQKENFLLCGDLNSLSRHDPYGSDFADRVHAAGIDKYEHPVRFEVMDDLFAFGWKDLLLRNGLPLRWWSAERRNLRFRVDYILASPKFAEHCVSAKVIPSGAASDHDALQAYFE